MDLRKPPETRPAEHLLRAHIAHAGHAEQLDPERERELRDALSKVSTAPAATPAPAKQRRRRSAK